MLTATQGRPDCLRARAEKSGCKVLSGCREPPDFRRRRSSGCRRREPWPSVVHLAVGAESLGPALLQVFAQCNVLSEVME